MTRHIAILGAGPTGLEAALAAVEAGLSFTVYETSRGVAGNVRSWGHVQLFTPWSMSVSPRARAMLRARGVEPPDGEACPTGHELVDHVLEPLAALPEIAPRLRLGARVAAIGREGLLKNDEIGTGGRSGTAFRLLVRESDGTERVEYAAVVLDCTGTYHNPNAMGIGGIRAPGESSVAEHVVRHIPDFEDPPSAGQALDPTDQGPGWRGRRILLVGAGHSAQTVARDLARVVERSPDTAVTWVIRGEEPTFGAVPDDPLPARDALVRKARSLSSGDAPFDVRKGRSVHAVEASPEGVAVTLRRTNGGEETVTVDRIISLTGAVGEAHLYRQLQVHECYATSGPMRLAAALLSSDSADCLAQESHGVDTLRNPEPDFFILGSKSYGRNNTFLMRVGWEQVEEVFELLGSTPATVTDAGSALTDAGSALGDAEFTVDDTGSMIDDTGSTVGDTA